MNEIDDGTAETEADAILKHCLKIRTSLDKEEHDKLLAKKLEQFSEEWKHLKEDVQIDRGCLINDAIYGPVELTPLMYKMINTSEFHRLKDIKQLGGAHYVYPGANHTRFDHSIGVCFLAGEFARHLQKQLFKDCQSRIVRDYPDWENLWSFEDKEVLCVQLAGLCHDLGHGPYSHMFEDNLLQQLEELSMTHNELSVKIFKHMLMENPKVLVEFVRDGLGKKHVEMIELMIQPETIPADKRKRAFLFEIVYNKTTGVDVNKWDYYARDCHYLGVTSDFQWRRCMHLGQIVKCKYEEPDRHLELHIAFRDKQLDDIYGMYRTGVILHQRAHQHKTIKAVEKMISDAFLEIHTCVPLIRGRDGTAKTIREALEEAQKGNLVWYLELTDSIIGTIKCADLKSVDTNLDRAPLALKRAQDLLRRVEERDLYHMAANRRIPKMYNIEESNGHSLRKNKLWEATLDKEKHQINSEAIYRFLDDDTKNEVKEGDVWVAHARFKLPPDMLEGANGDNPAEKVLFYKKRELDKEVELLTPEEIRKRSSLLVVPQAFAECELRVYDMRPAEKRKKEHKKGLEAALDEWKRQTEGNIQRAQRANTASF